MPSGTMRSSKWMRKVSDGSPRCQVAVLGWAGLGWLRVGEILGAWFCSGCQANLAGLGPWGPSLLDCQEV
jgi:hypothetical protein